MPPASSASTPRDGDRGVEAAANEQSAKAEEAKEKLKSQVAKSRKMIAILQSELADASSKRASEKEAFEEEVSRLKEQLCLNEELKAELANLMAERDALLDSAQQKEGELQQLREELQASLNRPISSHRHSAIPMSGEMLGSLSSFRPVQSPLEEGFYGHHDSQALMSSADLIGDDQLSSLEQSIISMDPAPLGSPLQSFPISPCGGGSLIHPMLAVSRLSHHSTMTQVKWLGT